MKVRAWNVYSVIRENARIVAATDHDGTVTQALNAAEDLARAWNAQEERPDMLVTILTCGGFVRAVPVQATLF